MPDRAFQLPPGGCIQELSHGEILPNSSQSSILDSPAAQKQRCHLCHCSPSAPYKCWLSFSLPVCTSTALLLAQVLTSGFRGSPAHLEKPWALLLSLPVSLGTEKQVLVELSCQSAGLLRTRFALRVQKRKGDEIPEQWHPCASQQVHNAQPVKYSRHKSQASGIWAKSLQGNICASPALPLWDLVSVARIPLEHQWPW